MPVRVMGYDYTVFKKQLDEYNNKKRELYQVLKAVRKLQNEDLIKLVQLDIERLGEFRLVPVITIILNFSHTRWNRAKSLKELASAKYPEITSLMQDYRVEIFDILYLLESEKFF